LAATGGTAVSTAATEFAGASIDSRTVARGQLFFALRAARDGHEFVRAAVTAGASGVVIERGREAVVPSGVTAVAVDDTRRARRNRVSGPAGRARSGRGDRGGARPSRTTGIDRGDRTRQGRAVCRPGAGRGGRAARRRCPPGRRGGGRRAAGDVRRERARRR